MVSQLPGSVPPCSQRPGDAQMSSATEALTLEEFCKRVKMGRTKAYEEVRAGRLIVRKNGKKSIVIAEDGQRYLDNLPRLELPPK